MHLFLSSLFLSFTLAVSRVVSALTATNIPVCSLIARQLGSKVSFPSQVPYNASIASYWYQQERLSPSCVVSPTSSEDVSTVIKLLTKASNDSTNAPALSIRSGGHAPLPGAANANDGVTIDLRTLAGVDVVASQSTASVGSGAIWSDVYNKVVPLNLTVVGARVADLGVGGLITGGEFQLSDIETIKSQLLTFSFRRDLLLLTATRISMRPRDQDGNCAGKRGHCQCRCGTKLRSLQGLEGWFQQFRNSH